jgi:APA family basic amino acid/polyamine antiporter
MNKPLGAFQLNFKASVSLIIGSIIGAGLFIKPASMAAQLGSPLALIAVWVLAGLFTLCGALVFAELGAMLPQSGGLFIHFENIFGPKTAFLYGWSAFSVINTASVAAIAMVCATHLGVFIPLLQLPAQQIEEFSIHLPYLGVLYPLRDIGAKGLAIFIVLFLSWINARSIQLGGRLQTMASGFNILILLLLVVAIFLSENGSVSNFWNSDSALTPVSYLGAWAAAMTGAFFAYDGWINIVSMAGEVKNPQRTIPKTLFIGVLVCISIYILVNLAYLYVLPVGIMANAPLVAVNAIEGAWNHSASTIVAFMIVCCTLGATNGNVMATSRITHAMGKARVFPSWTGKIDNRFQTPANALWLHGGWTSLLILTGTFELLADMFVFVTWAVYALGAIGILKWRNKHPELHRPYKIWGHPFTTLLFISFSLFYLGATIYKDIYLFNQGLQPVVNSLFGVLISLLGFPFYYYYQKSKVNGHSF